MNSYPITRYVSPPNKNTFSVKPIGEFVKKYLAKATISIDPFARDAELATYTNDLNPNTKAQYHLDAQTFLEELVKQKVCADLVIFDPPYSPRQIKEAYEGVGRKVTMQDTQNCVLYSRVRNVIPQLLTPNGICLSFGWNSNGLGKKHNFEIIEIVLVSHSAAHNDTICIAEQRRS